MHPAFSPTAAWVSLSALLIAAATDILALPDSVLATLHVPASDIAIIQAISTVIIIATGGHLAASRSVLPTVDKSA
jgi:hypothetical protein